MGNENDYDLMVIGAGSGGVRAARVAAGLGAKVAIAEKHRIGGTCVIRGCVPKKLLVYGAHFAEDLDDARRFGWQIEGASFDWPTLRDNVLAKLRGSAACTARHSKIMTSKSTKGTRPSPVRTACASTGAPSVRNSS